MSKDIENKVVSMEFDNSKFEKPAKETISTIDKLKEALHFKNVTKGFEAMRQGIKPVTFAPIEKAIDSVYAKFTFMERFTIQLYDRLANKIISTGRMIASEMFTRPISTGKSEYEEKMGAVQTIMASSKKSLAEVNETLAELNKYADDTIYSFSDMTASIGKFTNAGVDLKDAVAAIKGISNEAALSGANANEASRAMYNFAQALSSGSVKLVDWKSIENANMATKEFKQELIDTAVAEGQLTKQADGYYRTLKGNTFTATAKFNDTLQDQWMTSQVLIKTLARYSSETEDVGRRANAAAKEVKTFSMLIDTLKEALQSGWSESWENIIGDFEQAKQLWTGVSNVIGGLIERMSDARNTMLKFWSQFGGRTALLQGISNAWKALTAILGAVRDAFIAVFPPMTGQKLVDLTKRFEAFTAKLRPTQPTILRIRDAFKGFFAIIGIGVDALKAFYKIFAPLVGKAFSFLSREVLKTSAGLGQWLFKLRQTIKEGQLFEKIFSSIATVFKAFGSAFKTVFEYISKVVTSFKTGGFTAGLKAIANGFAELLSSLWKTIKKYNPLQAVKNLGVKIAEAISQWPVGQAVVKFVTSIKNAIVNSPVWKLCKDIVLGFVHAIQAIINKFRNVDTSATEDFTNNVKKGFGPLEAIGKFFSAIWKGIVAVWSVVGPTIKTLGKAIAKAFGDVFKGIGSMLEKSDLSDAGAFAAGGGLAALMGSMAKFVWDLGQTAAGMNKAVKNFGKVLKNLSGFLKALSFERYARSLKDIAIAVALLAGSMLVLAAMPADGVMRALGVMSMLFKSLQSTMTSFAGLQRITEGNGAAAFLTIGAQLLLMASAISILVANMMILSLIPYNALVKGIGMLVFLLRALSSEAIRMSSEGGNGKVVGALIGIGVMLQLLIGPLLLLTLVAGLNTKALFVAVSAVVLIVGAMVGATVLLQKSSSKFNDAKPAKLAAPFISLGLGLVAICVGLGMIAGVAAVLNATKTSNALDKAVKAVGSILKHLIAFGVLLVLASALATRFAKFTEGKSSRSFKLFGRKKISTESYKSGNKIGGVFAPVVGAFLTIGIAMIGMAAAISIIAIATKGMKASEFDRVVKTFTTMLKMLGVIVVLVAIFSKTENKVGNLTANIKGNKLDVSLFPKMASYILAFSAFVISMAVAAKLMNSVKIESVIATFAGVAGIIVAITVLAALLGKMPTFTKGFIVVAKGMKMFAAAALFLSIGVGVVVASLALLSKAAGKNLDSFTEKLSNIVDFLNKNKDKITDAIAAVFQIVLEGVALGALKAVGRIVTIALQMIHEIFTQLRQNGGQILAEVWWIIGTVLDSIMLNAPEITAKLVLALVSVIKGLADAIKKNAGEIIEAINSLLEAVLKVAIGLFGRIFGVSVDKLEDFENSILPHAKRIAGILIGMFAVERVTAAASLALKALDKAKNHIKTLGGDLFKSKNVKDSAELWHEMFNATAGVYDSAENVGKSFMGTVTEGIKKATGAIGKFVSAHPALVGIGTAAIVVATGIKLALDHATKTMTVVEKADREATDIANRMRQREEEYQKLVAKRKEAMEESTSGFDRYAEYARKLNDEIISVDGTIVKGQEQQFEWYKQQLAGIVELKIGEDGRIKIINDQNKALDYQAATLDKIIKKQRQQRQLESVQQDYDEALKKRDEYYSQYTTAKEKLDAFGGQIASSKIHLDYLDPFLKDQTVDKVIYRYKSYQKFLSSGLSKGEAIRKAFDGAMGSYSEGALKNAYTELEQIGSSLVGQQQNLADEVDLLGRQISKNLSFIRAYESAERKVAEGAEDADAALRTLASNPIFADTLIGDNWTKKYATLQIESEEAIKRLANAVTVTPWKNMSGTMRTEYMDVIKTTFDQLDKAGYHKSSELGRWLEKGLQDGLEGEQLVNYMTTYMGRNLITPAYKAVDANSPSKVFMELGGYCAQGLAIGMNKDSADIEKSFAAAAAASIAAYQGVLDADQSAIAWAPLIDTTGIQNGTAAMQKQFGALQTSLPTSMTSKLAASVDTSSINMDNSKIVESLGFLQEQLAELQNVMASMQVVMDSGQLVGALAPGMDAELGRRVVRKERGV